MTELHLNLEITLKNANAFLTCILLSRSSVSTDGGLLHRAQGLLLKGPVAPAELIPSWRAARQPSEKSPGDGSGTWLAAPAPLIPAVGPGPITGSAQPWQQHGYGPSCASSLLNSTALWKSSLTLDPKTEAVKRLISVTSCEGGIWKIVLKY